MHPYTRCRRAVGRGLSACAAVAAPIALIAFGVVLLGGLSACGGGGGGGTPEPPILINLGAFSATEPSRVSRSFLNPLNAPATVNAITLSGPFEIDPGDLPAQVGASSAVNLGIVFKPEGPGDAEGEVVLRYSDGTRLADQAFSFRASGEAIEWTVNPSPLDFGDVLPGDEVELDVELTNTSQRSPVTLTSAIIPSSALSFSVDPFPLTVAAGQTRTVRVRYAPTAISGAGGILRLGSSDVGGPVDITVWANSSGTGERVVDFGTQSLSGGVTPELIVDVPDTCVSITFEGSVSDGAQVGVNSIIGPGGKTYIAGGDTGNVQWVASPKSFALHLPNSDEAATQLVPGGGEYKFRLQLVGGLGVTMDVRAILELRANKQNDNAILPLNIFLADGLTPSAATAANDANLQSMLTQMGQILNGKGISLGDIDYYDLLDPSFDDIAQGEELQLFPASGGASQVRLNLFLVKRVWNGNLLGISGSIDGPKRQGESVTGVCSIYFDQSPGALALVVAHELCHYLGLWHTVEVTGTWDRLNDTPNCPPQGTNGTCSVEGGGLLMHWQANGGSVLSPGQGKVLRGHCLLRPPGQGGSQLQRKRDPGPWTPDAETLEFLARHKGPWCGTQLGR